MKQIWQIAAGDSTRNYTDIFLGYDCMFLGPGRYGPYHDDVYHPLIDKGLWTRQKISWIKQFATKVNPEDIVLLRNTYRVVSIGIVEGGYEHDETFDDVFGWDLQHTRRVIWQHHLNEELEKIQKAKEKEIFGGRLQIPMFTAVKDQKILDRIAPLCGLCQSRPLKPMPIKVPEPLTLEELGEELFSRGLPNEAVDKVILAIQRQRRLAKWYEEHGEKSKRPKEHEVVAHMILPFLLALSWSEQLLAVEWKRIDLAAFSGTPTTAENCCLVCEAKPFEHGLQNTFAQATTYVEHLKLDRCKKVLLTDGIRLYLYQRLVNKNWNEVPVGYLNIKLIRTNHVAPANTNAVETIMALTPAGINRVSMNTEL